MFHTIFKQQYDIFNTIKYLHLQQFPEITAFIMRRFKGEHDVEETYALVRQVMKRYFWFRTEIKTGNAPIMQFLAHFSSKYQMND